MEQVGRKEFSRGFLVKFMQGGKYVCKGIEHCGREYRNSQYTYSRVNQSNRESALKWVAGTRLSSRISEYTAE